MNGFMIPPFMGGSGGAGGNVLTVPSLNPNVQTQPLPGELLPNISDYQPPVQQQVYSDIGPIYATDQPALVPGQTSVPFWQEPYLDQVPTVQQWYDWQAPLDTEGFIFPETVTVPLQQPASLTLPDTSPTWFDWEAPLQFDEPSGRYYIPESTLPKTFDPAVAAREGWDPASLAMKGPDPAALAMEQQHIEPKPSGPLEFIGEVGKFVGDVVKTGLDVVWDIGAGILDKMQISISETGFKAASPYYTFNYPTDTLIAKQSEKTYAEVTKIVEQGRVTGTPSPGPARAGLLESLNESLSGVSPTVLLVGGGIVLFYLYSRK